VVHIGIRPVCYGIDRILRLFNHLQITILQGLKKEFCISYLPKNDCTMTLVDEKGDEFDTKYFADRTALSGGWQGFAVAHKLIDGDACVFQLIKPTTLKVTKNYGDFAMLQYKSLKYSTEHYFQIPFK
jgi:B3 DNA binding domain